MSNRAASADAPQSSAALMSRRLADPHELVFTFGARWIVPATWAFVVLGIFLRLSRYLLRFSLWVDEASLAMNFIERDYQGLLQPLGWGQTAPWLFLWAEYTIVKLWGFHEPALRLLPLLSSFASMVLFRHLAARLLQGLPQLLAVAVFAVSHPLIRHGAEVKPYASDLLFALVLLSVAVEWLRSPERVRWLWMLAGVTPLCLASSFPAVFIAGGVSVALLPAVLRGKRAHVWWAYGAFNTALVLAFGLLYFLFLRPHYDAHKALMLSYWHNAFPTVTDLWQMIVWLVTVHTGEMMAYPIGGRAGGSSFTAVVCLLGLVALWRQRRYDLWLLCCAPLALAIFAAALHRYPYGEYARTMQYTPPAICLLFGVGLSACIVWLRGRRAPKVVAIASVALLGFLGAAEHMRDLVRPGKTSWDQNIQEFDRWFWRDIAKDAELVCAQTDLNFAFSHRCPIYLCNQRIYSRRHRRGETPRWDRIAVDHPLRVVLYKFDDIRHDTSARDAWLEQLAQRHHLKLTDVDHYCVNTRCRRLIDVYEFLPDVPRCATASSGSAP